MTDRELIDLAQSLNERDEPYAMVTVVRVGAPSSAYVGTQAIVLRDGTLHGWIAGGCARDIVIASAQEAIATGKPALVHITNDGKQAGPDVVQHAMRCASGGAIEFFVQPHGAATSLGVLGDTPAAGEARALAQRLGIRVVADLQAAAVVLVATQGSGDAEALAAALASPAEHVLMIASCAKADRLREAMRLRGIREDRLARLQAPAGPDIGAKTPGEIALAAMAGVLAAIRGKLEVPVEPVRAAAPSMATKSPVDTFINPVCGTAVVISEAMHVERYAGRNYYFCCDGCWNTFRQDPDRFAAVRQSSQPRAAI
jgi:xanthine dehydrogenase accessory factor